MKPAHVVEIVTPKKFALNGLWFGSKKPKRAIIWVHGLGSSMFSKLILAQELVDAETAVLTFNNRGFERVAQVRRVDDSKKKRILAGAAHEIFTDCVDDIQGAINTVKKLGVKNIYIAGHSTGCQKAAYWASKMQNGSGVMGIVLLAPVSDYTAVVKKYGLPKIRHVAAVARAMIKSGKGDELIPSKTWAEEPDDARRFISLYTPDSIEQSIFSYFDPKRPARLLSAVRIPILAILGEKDEFLDRSATEVIQWLETHTRAPLQSLIAKNANHGFKGAEASVAKAIRAWIVNK